MPTTSTMTLRERWLALLDGRSADRVPTDYWATAELHQRLKCDLDCPDDQSLWQRLHVDRPRHLGPRCLLTHHPHDPQADIWGRRHRDIDYGTGIYSEVVFNPLAHVQSVEELERFRWPSPDDYDYQPVADALARDDGERCIFAGVYEPFLLYCHLRGLEQSYEDLLVNPELAEAILQHIFEFYYEQNRRIFDLAGGRIDATKVAEDLGSQTGPLLSLELYRRFLLPNQKKMADLARSYGIRIFYHTDGAARIFLPDLVNVVGIEILNPIQWRCPGMERETLVRDYGDRVIFHGAMDNQHTLPFGTVREVIDEVADNVRIFAGSRWICAPCHNMQAVTPTENVVAMYETIHELGKR
jgi:uroporphyrinogen decarboxylase